MRIKLPGMCRKGHSDIFLSLDANSYVVECDTCGESTPVESEAGQAATICAIHAAVGLVKELIGEPLPDKARDAVCELGLHLRAAGLVEIEDEFDRRDFNEEIDAYLARTNRQ